MTFMMYVQTMSLGWASCGSKCMNRFLIIGFFLTLTASPLSRADSILVEDWRNLPSYITQEIVDAIAIGVRDMGYECESVTYLDGIGGEALEADSGDGFTLSCNNGTKRYDIIHEGSQVWRVTPL